MTQSFAIPLPLPQLNDVIRAAKGHWAAYAVEKKRHTSAVAWMAKAARLQAMAGPVSVTCTWHMRDRRVDPDNCSHGTKYILDGLVVAGVLPGDGQGTIKEIHHIFAAPSRDNARVEVALQEVPA